FVRQCLLGAANIQPPIVDIYDHGWPPKDSDLDGADAIVFFTDGRDMHTLKDPARLAKIDELAGKGVGLAFLHYSIDPPDGAEETFLKWIGGCYKVGQSQNPINTATVSVVNNGHPISSGCGGYRVEDEWYFDLGFRPDDPAVAAIATGGLPPRDPRDQVLAWAYERTGGGRGFGFSGGHYHQNWHIEPFRKLILNAIVWTAGMEVPAGGVDTTQTWTFVSIPGFVGADLEHPQTGGEDVLGYVLDAIKAEQPEFVLVAGNLVMGQWPDKETIAASAEEYYTAWKQRMEAHGLKYYTALGDHEIGGKPWPPEKAARVSFMKRQYIKHLAMPLNGPLRLRGTAFSFLHENTLFMVMDVFESGQGPQGGIVCRVSGEQLEWLEQTIAANPGVEHIVVMGHTPVLGPAPMDNGDPLMLEGGADSPFWQAIKKHNVSLYLCGGADTVTSARDGNIVQIAGGTQVDRHPKVQYLVATVTGGRIDLRVKEIEVLNEGGGLPRTGETRPSEIVRIADDVKAKGFATTGAATLTKTEGVNRIESSGCLAPVDQP
ncbi:MAG TPA: hypothetical protein ENN81_07995, partial [Phycisphaerales bacterium]|nr:hypothetical protein [Phycisphaerales bacterium]